MSTASKDVWDEYYKRHQLHLRQTKQSLAIVFAFYKDGDDTRMKNILSVVEKSRNLIDKEGHEFYVWMARWKQINESMIQSSNPVNQLHVTFSDKGHEITGIDFSSLYIFLRCKDVDSLDSLWGDYTDGQLLLELSEKFPGISDISITIAIENYGAYRRYLGKFWIVYGYTGNSLYRVLLIEVLWDV